MKLSTYGKKELEGEYRNGQKKPLNEIDYFMYHLL
jgi:hypothetical protein